MHGVYVLFVVYLRVDVVYICVLMLLLCLSVK